MKAELQLCPRVGEGFRQKFDARQNFRDFFRRQRADFFFQIRFINSKNLKDINLAVFLEVGFAFIEGHISRGLGPL